MKRGLLLMIFAAILFLTLVSIDAAICPNGQEGSSYYAFYYLDDNDCLNLLDCGCETNPNAYNCGVLSVPSEDIDTECKDVDIDAESCGAFRVTACTSGVGDITCTDSDSTQTSYRTSLTTMGKVTKEVGGFNNPFYTKFDACEGGSLIENYCAGNVNQTRDISCAFEFGLGSICSNGACTSPTPTTTCSDSDGGVNYLSAGNVTVGNVASGTDSCNADGSVLTEYYCEDETNVSIDYNCDCVSGEDGGYCELGSGAGQMACPAVDYFWNSDSNEVVDVSGNFDEDIVDEVIKAKVESGNLILKLSRTPVKSRVNNEITFGSSESPYYCGLDLKWHQTVPTLNDLSCVGSVFVSSGDKCSPTTLNDINSDGSIDQNDVDTTKCVEDYQCQSNSCVDGYCISISSELKEQRGILVKMWCAVATLPSFITGGTDSEQYLACLANPFPGG
jgi:hypothetical protein